MQDKVHPTAKASFAATSLPPGLHFKDVEVLDSSKALLMEDCQDLEISREGSYLSTCSETQVSSLSSSDGSDFGLEVGLCVLRFCKHDS